MKLKIELRPFSFRLSENDGYGISLMGFEINGIARAVGFNFHSTKKPECMDKMLVIFFYGFVKRIVIKRIKHDHYICNYCKNPVWKHSFYCQKCGEDMLECEVTWVEIDSK